MTNRDLSTLKTSSILFVGGFLFMSALALLGSAGAALGSPQANEAGPDAEAQLAWNIQVETGPFLGPSADSEAELAPLSPSAPR
jgi:hypothetical protein